MKRDLRFRALSSEHHHALVLARRVLSGDCREDLCIRFHRELEPHFLQEERLLLPGLAAAGAGDLVARTREDHAFLREKIAAIRAGEGGAAEAFALRLQEHVRFEERELFPACEAMLPGALLDALTREPGGESSPER